MESSGKTTSSAFRAAASRAKRTHQREVAREVADRRIDLPEGDPHETLS